MGRKVLCVCVGNRSRSPMMQALLQQHLGKSFVVESAGVWRKAVGASANSRSIMVMQERGIDLTPHVGRWVGDVPLTDYSHIVCVDEQAAADVRALLPSGADTSIMIANAGGGGIPDPYELGIEGYRACLALLDTVMPIVASEIVKPR
ncbi:MAG TPA: low molecular weight phosphatase family protein [Rhizomicrobium sp.]